MSTTHDWSARIEWAGPTGRNPEPVAEYLLDLLGGDSATYGTHTVAISLTIDNKPGYSTAHTDTVKRIQGAAPDGWELVGIELRRADLLEADLDIPPLPPLAGISEAAEILGVTRQRAHAMAQTAGFPPPVADLASGPVYLEHAVRSFAAIPRRAGRPPRSA